MSMLLPALIGAIGSVGLGAIQTSQNYNTVKNNFNLEQQNYQFQKDSYLQNFEYQKNLQNQIFAREDNAVQRRVSDLQAAGLSKTLAAGDGAGVGSVVSTSPFSGSSPKMSQVDLVSTGLQLAGAIANMRQISAQTENTLKQNEVMDSQILNDQVNRDYTMVKTALEQGNLDMLPLTKAQKQAQIDLTNKQLSYIDEQITASIQNRDINDYKLKWILPREVTLKIEQISNLQKQGEYYDADVKYKELQGDLLSHNITSALYQSKIAELDYYYQKDTGFKPRSASPFVGDVASTLTSDGYKKYWNFLGETWDNFIKGYKDIIASFSK